MNKGGTKSNYCILENKKTKHFFGLKQVKINNVCDKYFI